MSYEQLPDRDTVVDFAPLAADFVDRMIAVFLGIPAGEERAYRERARLTVSVPLSRSATLALDEAYESLRASLEHVAAGEVRLGRMQGSAQ